MIAASIVHSIIMNFTFLGTRHNSFLIYFTAWVGVCVSTLHTQLSSGVLKFQGRWAGIECTKGYGGGRTRHMLYAKGMYITLMESDG